MAIRDEATRTLRRAYQAGRTAYHEEKPRFANPFDLCGDGSRHAYWNLGWDDAAGELTEPSVCHTGDVEDR